jgi:hemoglobin
VATVYDQIGGKDAVSAAVDSLYDRLLADPELAPRFEGTDMTRQKAHMRAFMASAIGGHEIYSGRDVRTAHASLRITAREFDRVVDHLVSTLVSLSVPISLIEAIGAKLAPLRAQIVAGDAPAAAAA